VSVFASTLTSIDTYIDQHLHRSTLTSINLTSINTYIDQHLHRPTLTSINT